MLFNRKPDHSGNFDLVGVRMPESLPPVEQMRAVAHAQNGSTTQLGSATQSVIDAWLTITGTLESEGDVRVEGKIKGDIRCAHLVVGRDATVSGDIVAEEAVVRGKVRGSIRANRVILQDSACVESDIYHRTLSIDEGACFDGQSCHRQHPFQEGDTDNAESQPGEMRGEAAAGEAVERTNGTAAEDALRSLGA
jgi:cytoskeletal protein CcmA (bactofilin family)